MTDEIDLMRKIIKQYDRALRVKKLNEDLYSHLIGSIYYLLKYSEKYSIPLPQKHALLGMVQKADFIIDQFALPTKNQQPDKTPSDSTESIIDIKFAEKLQL